MDGDTLNLIIRLCRLVLKDDTISLNNAYNVDMLKKKYNTNISEDSYSKGDVFVCYSPYDDNIYSVSVHDLVSEMIDALDGEW